MATEVEHRVLCNEKREDPSSIQTGWTLIGDISPEHLVNLFKETMLS